MMKIICYAISKDRPLNGQKEDNMKKLEMRLDLFGDETAGAAPAAEAAAPAGTEQAAEGSGDANTGVSAQPQREGRRQNIFPRVSRVETQRAQPRKETVRQFPAATEQPQLQQQAPQPAAAAAMTWEEAKKQFKTEYGADVKAAVDERFRNHADQSAKLSHTMQILSSIAPFYGINPDESGNFDLDKLSAAIQDDNRFYEQSALEKGIPVETEKHIRQLEMQQKQRDMEARKSLEQEQLRAHLANLRQQEAELKKEFPDFDLMTEVQNNPAFARMTAPGGGLNLRQAYQAFHGDEIAQRTSQATEQRTKQNMSRAIQAGAMRPQENGMTASGGLPKLDPANMSREQRRELRRRAEAGEKIALW